jgi:hypothetical protein
MQKSKCKSCFNANTKNCDVDPAYYKDMTTCIEYNKPIPAVSSTVLADEEMYRQIGGGFLNLEKVRQVQDAHTRHSVAARLLAISKEYGDLKSYETAVMEYQKELEDCK